ncbi:DUF6371 domain-containing protein [Formosa sp. PL04]|uniref:DUF6371 domain-containing protein n=1 Tax=Formosa sp. PL04 TaxID=3081755 RepID=UPI002982B2ED|nr:DUF6371 domain-containing protein [Formosa sp. PL04]MDW5287202.1 DUF6371 domain-containing protein [Formosa sp. PL04]
MHKYSLHRTSKKDICPQCGKKRFVKYIDQETGDYLSSEVGRCDRVINCAYHYPPRKYFQDHKIHANYRIKTFTPKTKTKVEVSFHKKADLQATLSGYEKNNFVQYLYSNFDAFKVDSMVKDYKIGTAQTHYNGTVFWQIDDLQKIRAGKIIKYDKQGHRTKYINWVHAIQLKRKVIKTFHLNQCLFGLHLLYTNSKTIAIVESEKTACVMSLLFDKYVWMATGSLNGLNKTKLNKLKNRTIILYPDLGMRGLNGSPFTQWKAKMEDLNTLGFDIKISDLLELKSAENERLKGLDIADYFLTQNTGKPTRIIGGKDETVRKLYHKNKSLKTLIDVFDLCDLEGESIKMDVE